MVIDYSKWDNLEVSDSSESEPEEIVQPDDVKISENSSQKSTWQEPEWIRPLKYPGKRRIRKPQTCNWLPSRLDGPLGPRARAADLGYGHIRNSGYDVDVAFTTKFAQHLIASGKLKPSFVQYMLDSIDVKGFAMATNRLSCCFVENKGKHFTMAIEPESQDDGDFWQNEVVWYDSKCDPDFYDRWNRLFKPLLFDAKKDWGVRWTKTRQLRLYAMNKTPCPLSPGTVELLVERGAMLNSTDDEGNTVLHLAVKCRNMLFLQKASIVYGIGYGDPDIQNTEGLSPLDLARMLEYDEEKRIIKEIYKKCNLSVKTFCAYCDQRCKQACSRCNLTYYCSREHQRIHWPFHKKECKRLRKSRKKQTKI